MLAARLPLAYVIVEISKISLRKSATRSEQSLLTDIDNRTLGAVIAERDPPEPAEPAEGTIHSETPTSRTAGRCRAGADRATRAQPQMLQMSRPALAERRRGA